MVGPVPDLMRVKQDFHEQVQARRRLGVQKSVTVMRWATVYLKSPSPP
jgi:hypothetical protein